MMNCNAVIISELSEAVMFVVQMVMQSGTHMVTHKGARYKLFTSPLIIVLVKKWYSYTLSQVSGFYC